MNGSDKHTTHTLGMYDLLKGFIMLIVVLMHSRSLFPGLLIDKILAFDNVGYTKYTPAVYGVSIIFRIVYSLILTVAMALIPALMVIAGYGFRKRTIAKSFLAQFKKLLRPYVITTVAATAIHCLIHYATFRNWPGALGESAKVLFGMILGFTQTITIGNFTFFANGAIWYILSVFWSLTIFSIIVNKASEKNIKYFVLVLSVIGWALSYVKYTPWAISQGLVGLVYVYIGYKLKQRKFFIRGHETKGKRLFIFAIFIPNLIMSFFGMVMLMADNVYSLGPISYIWTGLMAVGVISVALRMNVLRGRLWNGLRRIGRYSLYFLCVHTVEMIAVPWYEVAKYFEKNQLLGFWIIYVLRLTIILCGCYIVVVIKRFITRYT